MKIKAFCACCDWSGPVRSGGTDPVADAAADGDTHFKAVHACQQSATCTRLHHYGPCVEAVAA